MKTKKGKNVLHNGKIWIVKKVLIPGRRERKGINSEQKAYISAFPTHNGQTLFRSGKIIGQNWENIK